MHPQEPEKAVNAFVSAMESDTKDTELILRVARALVTTHDYAGSIDYYNKVSYEGEIKLPIILLQCW